MARIYKDADGNVTGSSQSTTAGGCLGLICVFLLVCFIVGMFAH